MPPASSIPCCSARANFSMWPYMEYCGEVSQRNNDRSHPKNSAVALVLTKTFVSRPTAAAKEIGRYLT